MKYLFTLLIFLAFSIGCKPKILSGEALQNKLIETMDDYLHKTLKPGAQFTVKDVIFYPEADKKIYICQFHVSLHYATRDTTGIMGANISNDFKTVERTQ